MATKNISLDDDYLKKLRPYIEKHGGNFSSAIRDIIDTTKGSAIPENASCVYSPLFNWLLSEIDGRLIPYDILCSIIHPSLIHRICDIDQIINKSINELNWNVDVQIDCDNDRSPSSILLTTTGNYQRTKIVSLILSQFIVQNSPDSSPFAIRSLINNENNVKIELIRVPNKKDGIKSLTTFFGGKEEAAKAMRERNSFWKCIINRHVISNYQMVTIHKNYFEDILAGKIPMGEIMIEILAKKPLQDIPLEELIPLIKQVYKVSGAVERVENRNNDIILFHSYRSREAIERIKKSLIMLMETSGHLYDGKITANMIVLSHKPDIGMKINNIVNNLKESGSRLDKELILFLSFLEKSKYMSDISIPISILGRRIGISLMKEYEDENNIKKWDLATFRKAFEVIDAKIHRDSEWKLEENNLLYRVRKCDITMDGDTFDNYICRIARETFKGALNHAFGDKFELDIKKLVTHGDNYCEVMVRVNNNK